MGDNLKYLSLLFPIVGVGALIGGLKYRSHLKARVSNWARIQGKVIGNAARGGVSFGTATRRYYYPIVEYFVGSHRFSVKGDTGYGRRKAEGSKLLVMFDPANPSSSFIVEDYYLPANMLLAIGSVFVSLGSFIAYHLIQG